MELKLLKVFQASECVIQTFREFNLLYFDININNKKNTNPIVFFYVLEIGVSFFLGGGALRVWT